MRTMGRGLALPVLTALAAVAPLDIAGQEPRADGREAPASVGDYFVSFHLPDGGGSGLGLGFQATDRTRLQFVVQGEWSRSRVEDGPGTPTAEDRMWFVDVGPELRLYGLQNRKVLPFFHLAVSGGYGELADGATRTRVGGELGFGAEWFPFRTIGISGQTGVGGSRVVSEPPGGGSTSTDLRASFFRSGLSLNLYF